MTNGVAQQTGELFKAVVASVVFSGRRWAEGRRDVSSQRMDEGSFILPVTYRGQELAFEGRIVPYGYIHRLEIIIHDVPVLFEPDEERNYRALIEPRDADGKNGRPDAGLLQAIAAVLESLR